MTKTNRTITAPSARLREITWRQQQRASLYHVLLREWLADGWLIVNRSEYPDDVFFECQLCNALPALDIDDLNHDESCKVGRTKRALAADADQVAAMLADVAEERKST